MGESKQILGNWKFKACKDDKWMDAVVPGCVHADLLRAGAISDPFYGTNEHDLQWIDKVDWEYETCFDINAGLLGSSNLQLVFDGLDTYADVLFNGIHVLSANNMFRSWKADVKGIAKEQDNVLKIRFRSPVKEDLPKIKELGYNLPATNDQSELGGLGEDKISVFARKAPYHYGWDWGPRFVTSGIWREARLEGWTDAKISDIHVKQDRVTAEEAALTVGVTIESDREANGLIRLSTEGRSWEYEAELKRGTNLVQIPVTISKPRLWWSRGLGEAYLHTFKAELLFEHGLVAAGSARTGLRAVRLVRDKDEAGASFYFELNGVPVFAKGANHIPNDSFVTDVTEERYRHEIATAVESNMNMLRVWGGGIYEQPAFYELCDEHGILVWQDFMFACSMYPGDQSFLDNVRAEAEENVKRLRNHPCIVLWCGNNEIDSAWAEYDEHGGWGWKQHYTMEQRKKIWSDYEVLFHQLLPDVVREYAPGTAYWPSSPLISLTGDIRQHAHPLSSEGDIHYWGVWHAVEPFENYHTKIGRFMSEYGFQSFPEYGTVMTFAAETDLALDSKVMRAHQKNGDGNRLIKEYMDIYMSEPKDFQAFLYMSQVLQAEAMKMAIEAHRRKKPYCMGTLYWQMNDCWPVASWSGMDYFGKWKAMQYYAKNSFADTMVSFDRTDGGMVQVYVVHDGLTALSGDVIVTLYDFNGRILKRSSRPSAVDSNSSAVVFAFDEKDWLGGHHPGSVVLNAELWSDGQRVDGKAYYFVKSKELRLKACTIRIAEVEGSGGTKFSLTTDSLAKQVWLTSEQPGAFSDNFFDLIPGVTRTVEYRRREPGTVTSKPAVPGSIQVRSMVDFILNKKPKLNSN